MHTELKFFFFYSRQLLLIQAFVDFEQDGVYQALRMFFFMTYQSYWYGVYGPRGAIFAYSLSKSLCFNNQAQL